MSTRRPTLTGTAAVLCALALSACRCGKTPTAPAPGSAASAALAFSQATTAKGRAEALVGWVEELSSQTRDDIIWTRRLYRELEALSQGKPQAQLGPLSAAAAQTDEATLAHLKLSVPFWRALGWTAVRAGEFEAASRIVQSPPLEDLMDTPTATLRTFIDQMLRLPGSTTADGPAVERARRAVKAGETELARSLLTDAVRVFGTTELLTKTAAELGIALSAGGTTP